VTADADHGDLLRSLSSRNLRTSLLLIVLFTILNATLVYSLVQSNVAIPNSATIFCPPVSASFGIVGSVAAKPALSNFIYLFGNQSISYLVIGASTVTRIEDIAGFQGLVVGTASGGYNASAVKEYAKTHVVISDIRDFCKVLYPSLSASVQVASANKVTYLNAWSNFNSGDVVDMRNETGNVNQLTVVSTSALSSFSNITVLSRVDSSRATSFFMNGSVADSGFYVMDLDATTPDTKFAGIWNVFPAVKMVQDFPTGTYSEWMGNGTDWPDLSWVYSRVDAIVSSSGGIVKKLVIGQSVLGRSIPAMIIGTGSKNAIIDGSIHGDEKTGTFACLRIAELLVQYYRSDPDWKSKLTEYKVIIVPVVNPDGFASNTRNNARGINLNRQFPPEGTPTEPEAFALMNLMGNYTPTLYVNCHEGAYYYPLHMIYGAYLSGTSLTLTKNALQQANQTFVGLEEYGWFTDNGSHVWIGKVNTIVAGGGEPGMASDYASWAYSTSSTILETFMWSQKYDARQCLWGLDYYPAVTLSFLQNLQR